MPAINFLQRYGPAILAGTKQQTIRKPRVDGRPHATVGADLYLYTGMRTKSCRKLMDAVCTNTAQIVITNDPYQIVVNGERIEDEDGFAAKDGFENVADLYEFFDEKHGLPFHGTLIQWQPKRSPIAVKGNRNE